MQGSTEALLNERKNTHGEYREHARCTQAIMKAVMTERNWERLSDIQRESLHMFAHKMGRIAVGNPDEPDHWKDIAGYAVLVEQRLGGPPKLMTVEKAAELDLLAKPPPVPEATLIVNGTRLGIGDWCFANGFKALIVRIDNHFVTVRFENGLTDIVDFTCIKLLAVDPFENKQRTPEDGAQHAAFDAGNGRFEVGETCHYHDRKVKLLCQITSILQDGEADIDCGEHGHKTVKWRTLSKLPAFDPVENDTIKQRTPEDGAQHAAVTPWAVGPEYFRAQGINNEHMMAFWCGRNQSLFVLEPHVDSHTIPRVLRACYNLRGDGWTLRIDQCPDDAREFFPNLPKEQNMKEWEERPEWQRVLYTWDPVGCKYALTDMTWAWHVEAE